jgi:hypothetical protein
MVKAGIEVPFGSRDYPELQAIYDGIHSKMCALNDNYRKQGTELITQTLRVKAFQLRIERVKLFYNQLITNVTQFHISYYREEHKDEHKTDHTHPPKTLLQLATLTMFNLFQMLDLETLEYLDINRDTLCKIFLSEHKIVMKRNLNRLDAESVDYALNTSAGYIKTITVFHYKRNGEKERRTAAEAKVKAQMEAARAKNTMAAVNEAISTDCTTLPKDNPTLEKAVLHIVDRREQRKAKKKKIVTFAKMKHKQNQQPPTPIKRPATGNTNSTKRTHKKAKIGPSTKIQKQANKESKEEINTEVVKAQAGQNQPSTKGQPGETDLKKGKKFKKKKKIFPKKKAQKK